MSKIFTPITTVSTANGYENKSTISSSRYVLVHNTATVGTDHVIYLVSGNTFTDATCDYNNDPTVTHDANPKITAADPVLFVSGDGIPAATFISSITDSTHFELIRSTTDGAFTNSTLTFTPLVGSFRIPGDESLIIKKGTTDSVYATTTLIEFTGITITTI